ncbi:hypothetical protein ACFYY2_17450 [Streptomyces sp. NPDC001822]|uniref:hypothetical protein n=1 Tax=Streptomyces sp. NPDC001822 TaxID=3364614 RepID=UPI0036C33CF1
MRTTTAAFLAAGLLLAATGCSTTGDRAAAPAGKYAQTWPTPYSSTTCGDYLTAMDHHQRWALAADMLVGARKADGLTTLPADTDVDRFEQDMATACQPIATAKTTEIGASIYLMDTTYSH